MSRSTLLVAAACGLVVWKGFAFPREFMARGDAPRDLINYKHMLQVDRGSSGGTLAWNPHLNAGTPRGGDLSLGLTTIPLLMVLPDAPAVNLFILAHLLVGAFGMRAWARASGMEEAPATVAAIVYAMGAAWPLRIFAGHLSMMCVMGWGPVALACLERLLRAPSARPALGLAASAGAMLLGGHAQWIYIWGWMAGAVAIAGLRGPGLGRKASWLAGAVVAAAALGAVQLLPAFALLPATRRLQEGRAWEDLSIWLTWKDVMRWPVAYPEASGTYAWERLWAAGVCGTLLTILGMVAGRREPRTWLLAGLSAAAFLVALGPDGPFHRIAMEYLPLYNQMRAVPRFLFIFGLAAPLLAARGFAAASSGPSRWIAVGLTAAWLVAAFLGEDFAADAGGAVARGQLITFGFFMVGVVALAVRRPEGLVGVMCAEMATIGLILIQPLEAPLPYPVALPRDGRVYDLVTVPANAVGAGGHEPIRGETSMQSDRYLTYYHGIWGEEKSGRLRTEAYRVESIRRRALFDLLSIRHVITSEPLQGGAFERVAFLTGEIHVYRNQSAMPYAFTVPSAIAGDAFALAETHDIREFVALPPGTPAAEHPGDFEAVPMERAPGRLVVDSEGSGARYLVVSEPFWPGWEARVDGKPAVILPAWHALMGVPLEAGPHRIELTYSLPSLRAGAWISGCAWLAVCCGALLLRLRPTPPRP